MSDYCPLFVCYMFDILSDINRTSIGQQSDNNRTTIGQQLEVLLCCFCAAPLLFTINTGSHIHI